MSVLVKISAIAPTPLMHMDAAPRFEELRKTVLAGSGVDFLARCGDVLRPADFKSAKDCVANRSLHKTCRAFDCDQTNPAIVVVSEPRGKNQYFRTYLICADQGGSLGTRLSVPDYRGYRVNKYLFDYTAALEAAGFIRIPAWAGWRKNYNEREFWHGAYEQGLTWDQAMQQLKASPEAAVSAKSIIGVNDRDSNTAGRVTIIQKALNRRGLIPGSGIDGVYGPGTKLAVQAFQKASGLSSDGIVGPLTAKALGV